MNADAIARATSRHAHHEAGHAVAVIVRGGSITEVKLGTADWSTADASGDTPGYVKHRTPDADRAFVTFAGPWAEAMWMVEHNGVSDLSEALEYAWDNNFDGDAITYEARVEQIESVARRLGMTPVGRLWEADWIDELADYWPAVREVAAALVAGANVNHDLVREAVAGCEVKV